MSSNQGSKRGNPRPVSRHTPDSQPFERQSINQVCDLCFPVNRFASSLRKGRFADKVSKKAAIMMTAVIEYLTADLLEMSSMVAIENKKQRITPAIIIEAMRSDNDLTSLFKSKLIVKQSKSLLGMELEEISRGEDMVLEKRRTTQMGAIRNN